MQFHAQSHVTFILNTNKKPTRICRFDPFLSWASCDCMFVCLTSWQIRLQRHIFLPSTDTHSHKFVKLTLGFTHGWCHVKLLPPQRMFCVHHITMMHQFTLTLYSKQHTQGAYVFSCNLPSAFLSEWPGSFTCYCVNTAVRVSTES